MRCGYAAHVHAGVLSLRKGSPPVFYYNIKDVSVNAEGSKDASEVVDSELKKGLIF